MRADECVYFDVRTCELRLSEVMARISVIQKAHPEVEVFLDGDSMTVMGRLR